MGVVNGGMFAGMTQGIVTGIRSGVGRADYHKLDTVAEWTAVAGVTPTELFTLQETASPVANTTATATFATAAGSPSFGAATPYAGDLGLAMKVGEASRLTSTTTTLLDTATGAGNGVLCIVVGRYNNPGNYNTIASVGGSPSNGINFYSASALVPRVTIYDGVANKTTSFAVPRGDMGWGAVAFGVDRTTSQVFFAYRFGSETYLSTSDTSLGSLTSPSGAALGTSPSTGCHFRRLAFFTGDHSATVQAILNRICQ